MLYYPPPNPDNMMMVMVGEGDSYTERICHIKGMLDYPPPNPVAPNMDIVMMVMVDEGDSYTARICHIKDPLPTSKPRCPKHRRRWLRGTSSRRG